MKVEKESTVIIGISEKEAEILQAILGGLTGGGPGRVFVDELYHELKNTGVVVDYAINFDGKFGD